MASPPSAFADRTVRCESEGFEYKFCPADTRGGVQLAQQLSDNDCRRGENWGYDRRGIWVDEGCAAEFAVENRLGRNDEWGRHEQRRWDNYRYGSDYRRRYEPWRRGDYRYGDDYAGGYGRSSDWGRNTIRCESEEYDFQRCPADTRGGVELMRQLSDTYCQRGYNWGYDRRGIWVDEGCAAEFRVG
jgi:hypothetical protein